MNLFSHLSVDINVFLLDFLQKIVYSIERYVYVVGVIICIY